MEKEERTWLIILLVIMVAFNALTLSPLVPWQEWLTWSQPAPEKKVNVEIENYTIHLPANSVALKANEFVEFAVTSRDVTYGFGVFRSDGTMVFQMQVLPGYNNRMVWKFDKPGNYDVRSTEYSGPRHSEMFIKNALKVSM